MTIPKSRWFDFQSISWCAYSFNPAGSKSQNDINYQKFCCQLLHSLLQMVLKPIRPYMTSPKIICCPDSHYCWAIFSFGPYIVDYPKQCLLASIVQDWCWTYAKLYSSCLHTSDILCFRCNAPSCDMDSGQFIQCSEVHSELLCKSCGLQELWDDYGIVGYIKVMFFSSSMYNMWTNIAFIAIYYPLSTCGYPWFTLSQYSTSTHWRCFQRSHCHLGKWLYQGHSFWLRSQEDSRWYWSSVSLSHLPESTYLLTEFHLHCCLLVSVTFCKAKALCSGQVTTQKHWWRYTCG